jgi:hypothetical protein
MFNFDQIGLRKTENPAFTRRVYNYLFARELKPPE